jgi:tartrate-resistant acid phosphatase type 5
MSPSRSRSWPVVCALALAAPLTASTPMVVACSEAAACTEAEAMGSRPTFVATPAEPGSVRLIAVGDVGTGSMGQLLVARAMDAKCASVGGCDAVIMTGDNFYTDGVSTIDDVAWGHKFEQPYDLPNLHVPFYVVLGNHDVRSDWTAQVAYTKLPLGDGPGMRPSERWNMPAQWYDVRIRNVHLFAFDTANGPVRQAADMQARVRASDARWKISFAHHPRYTSGGHYFDNQELGENGMYAQQEAIFCGTQLYISGHDHNVEFIDKGRHAACPDTHFVVTGAGSKVRESMAPRDPSSLYFNDDIEGFAYLEARNDEIHFEFIDMCGNVRFTKKI